ncbi:hypothetical protein EN836_26700 [Mesorhizobium sp. M1C.F.Ca.ET.193.01.1.1]|uniref:hypothetical protein n=1 Tax=unclassified Mesorhizobium TaxID=325217 RepID=UPI000FD24754|nr:MULTISPECIES: hypothetical protein [unclassified Mesorhizobium]TGS93899.1 hypothetical protein EN820_47365 [bacterium M00.F.Ca.ET.177.01.1.1]TGQ50964.1 hypothetical protein EN853_26695 [Mesorhizobium sp. M1C.F.Ca.ET.210.01.1.1]TGQ66401.1 hypothetical protein EN855_026705 [Mesorhizobium sp. M1C.F.Ca.ET.212.01.1.1]TGR00487.1 hypothetical protein EN847_26695 [Mesorhizobium sp. M1C.F.Ca.ET.204.01.1.1]TGR21078.1 hypothetical protein EN839_26695 [Mesorhizobium sp. M1C.F.Ca.ET.196.01.1.1]
MAKLIVLGVVVLTIVEIVVELWELWKMSLFARSRRTSAPIPMHDEPDGVPTHAAPSQDGTNRLYQPTSL